MLRVFKDKRTGKDRWIAISSSAFEDREQETVSPAAVDYSIKQANGDYGNLRLYHLPRSDVGSCDFSTRLGAFLLESGTWDDSKRAEKVKASINREPDKYGVSIGFRYRPEDLVDGTYLQIKIFERSVVKESDAAALFTNIKMMEAMMEDTELMKTLTGLLGGDEAQARKLIEDAQKTGIKTNEGEEVSLKENTPDEDSADKDKRAAAEIITDLGAAVEKVVDDAVKSTLSPLMTELTTAVESLSQPSEDSENAESEEVAKEFVLELDDNTVKSLAIAIAEQITIPESQTEKLEEQSKKLKTLGESLDSLGAAVNHLLKSDEEKLTELRANLPRAKLQYRPSGEAVTKTTAPTPIETAEVAPAMKPIMNMTFQESLAAIEAARAVA